MNSRMFLLGLFVAVSAVGQPTTTTIPAGGGGVVVKGSADLVLTKTLTRPSFGGPATFSIVVTNLGPSPAAGPITVTDHIPSGASLSSIPGTPWSCSFSAPNLTCSRPGPMAVNTSYALTLTMNGTNPQIHMIENCASVHSNTPDPTPGNNSDCVCAKFTPCHDLTVDISTGSNNGVARPAGSQDPDWQVTSAPSGITVPVNAWVPSDTTGWVAAPAGSAWISATDPRSRTAGNYHYQFHFDIGDEWTGHNCTLNAQWAVDDEVRFKLDGMPFFHTPAFGTNVTFTNHSTLHPLTTTLGPGTHLLDVEVQNGTPGSTGDNSPSGLLISGNIVCTCQNKPDKTK